MLYLDPTKIRFKPQKTIILCFLQVSHSCNSNSFDQNIGLCSQCYYRYRITVERRGPYKY